MAQSPEYPDLKWMPPKSWTEANRTSVQLVVIHTTEGSAKASSAEDGAAYDQRRTDGTSTHYFHDCDSTVQCVRTNDRAHTARTQGNARGIHHELCTRAGSAAWGDTYHQAMLRRVAKQAARDAKKWGIPVRHLSVAQVAAGTKGFCGHVDVTNAFPQDKGTHTDPGSAFPWSQFLDLVQAELEEDDMPSAAEVAAEVIKQLGGSAAQAAIGKAVMTYDPGVDDKGKIKPGGIQNMDASGYKTNPTVGLAWIGTRVQVNNTLGYQNRDRLDKVLATLTTLAKAQGVAQADLDAIQAHIDALPGEVVDALTDPGSPPDVIAASLRAVLGDRAAAVGALLTTAA